MVNSYIRVAGAVTLEARRVVRHQLAVVLELDPDRVVSRAVARAVHACDWSIVRMEASDWITNTCRSRR